MVPPNQFSTGHMKDCRELPGLCGKVPEDFRGRFDPGIEPGKHDLCFRGKGQIPVLAGTDIYHFRLLFREEGEFLTGERRVTI
jgi:hypothetical protein